MFPRAAGAARSQPPETAASPASARDRRHAPDRDRPAGWRARRGVPPAKSLDCETLRHV